MFSNFESLPVIIIEALASGIPVISSDVGGIKEYISAQEGILVPKQNIDALTGAMDYMLDRHNDYTKEHLAEHALKNFSPEAIGPQLDSIYESVLTHG